MKYRRKPTPHSSQDPQPRRKSQISKHSHFIWETRRLRLPTIFVLVILGGTTIPLHGYDFVSSPSMEEKTAFTHLWQSATLYSDDANPLIQRLKLRGRYQGQYHKVDSRQGSDDDWEDRRSRLGFDAKLFSKTVDVRADFQSNDGFEDAYDRLVDAYVQWLPNESLTITMGRTKALIGYYDWLESTNTQPTFERSQIFNQLGVDRATSIILEGKASDCTWQLGAYSNDLDREFGSFRGAYSFGAGIGYDAKKRFGWKRADFRFDWLHSNHDADDSVLINYDDLFSATFWGQDGFWGFVAEGFAGIGQTAGRGDVFGFYLQPTYDLIPGRLQLVGHYSFAIGDGKTSVIGQRRYERSAPNLMPAGLARGDQYHALYLGTQYFIHGDNLKLMAGVEYADLSGGAPGDDYDGFTWLSGIRFFF